MNAVELDEILVRLRSLGGEASDIEVKRAAGGLPESTMATLSAFANRPGGGTILLGVDEQLGFLPAGVADPALMASALANKAREGFEPPVSVEISIIEPHNVLAARVSETPPSHKPCRRKGSAEAFMRFADGDFRLSEAEIEGFIANRTRPRFDQESVNGTTRDSLDAQIVESLCETARRRNETLRRVIDDELLLKKLGALSPDGTPTIAGLLSLSDYPQQWFPNFVIRAGATVTQHEDPSIRFEDVAMFDGPIPRMLDAAIDWARRSRSQRVTETADGMVTTESDIPPIVLRELLANAIVHRDLAPWSWSRATELRMLPDRMVLTNPGGLWGTTVERLGRDQITSSRNESLIRICQYLMLRDGNAIEAMATGIPRIVGALQTAGLPPVEFRDQGITFTAIVRVARQVTRAQPARRFADERVVKALRDSGAMSTSELAAALSVSATAVRNVLSKLKEAYVVEVVPGADGRSRRYRLVGAD